ncbi:MAG: hypothetical protein HUJ96_04560 [Marinilabiliaceae bacterium]|nr:hypothetical protein [Marinilabiliaceae bacterium]
MELTLTAQQKRQKKAIRMFRTLRDANPESSTYTLARTVADVVGMSVNGVINALRREGIINQCNQ